MPNKPSINLAELEDCRASIIRSIAELQKTANLGAKELRTLKSALMHMEELIKEHTADKNKSKKAASLPRKKSAA
jgi:hypothetical protein